MTRATVDIAQAYWSEYTSGTLDIARYLLESRGSQPIFNGYSDQFRIEVCSIYIFTRLSEFVVRCMQGRGFHRVFQYLDDFIAIEDSLEQCQLAHITLIKLLHSLGYMVSWKKVSSPSRRTKFLGVIFDSQQMKLFLPEEKLIEKLYSELEFFVDRVGPLDANFSAYVEYCLIAQN